MSLALQFFGGTDMHKHAMQLEFGFCRSQGPGIRPGIVAMARLVTIYKLAATLI